MSELNLTWKCLNQFKEGLEKYRGNVDCIVGILYGGGIFSIIASKVLGIPVYFIESERYRGQIPEKSAFITRREITVELLTGKRVLLIDDLVDDGVTMTAVKEEISRMMPTNILPLVYISKDIKYCESNKVDFFRKVKKGTWVIFPWELGNKKEGV